MIISRKPPVREGVKAFFGIKNTFIRARKTIEKSGITPPSHPQTKHSPASWMAQRPQPRMAGTPPTSPGLFSPTRRVVKNSPGLFHHKWRTCSHPFHPERSTPPDKISKKKAHIFTALKKKHYLCFAKKTTLNKDEYLRTQRTRNTTTQFFGRTAQNGH